MDTSPSELILLDGTVSSVIYRNEENGYTILRLEAPEAGEEVTVVGTMPASARGRACPFTDSGTRHSTYGEQFRAEIVERRMPVGEKALLEYLASGAVKGVGAAMARRLLDAFGEDVLTVIEEAPRRLTEVKGISPKRAETIHQSLCMQLSSGGCWIFTPPMALPLPGHAPVPAVWRPGPHRPAGQPLPSHGGTPLHPLPRRGQAGQGAGTGGGRPSAPGGGASLHPLSQLGQRPCFSPLCQASDRRPAAAGDGSPPCWRTIWRA